MNTMSAFFSSQDDSDDRSSINFSGVVGQLNNPNPATTWRFNYTNKKFKAEFSDIFEVPKVQAPAIPDGWLDKVKTPAPVTTHAYHYKGKQQGGPDSMLPVHPNVGRGGHHRQGNCVPIGGVTPGSGMGFIPTDSFLMQASDEEIEQTFGLTGKRGGTQKKAQGNGAALVDRCPTQEDQAVIDSVEGEGWAETEAFSPEYQSYMKELAGMYPWDHPQDPFVHPLNKTADVQTARGGVVSKDPDVNEVHGEHIPDEGGLYEMHVTEFGPDIADAYDEVSEGMAIIAGEDDLMLELISDMVGLLSPGKASAVISGIAKVSSEVDPTQCRDVATELFGLLPEDVQAETFKDLYHQLPKAIKDRIANFGF